MPEEELFSFLEKRKNLLDGVCITGGEPLLQPDISAFLSKIKKLGYLIKLDTNGSFPDKLKEIVSLGLCDYVAMDIKNSPEKYPLTAGTKHDIMPDIQKSVEFLLSGKVDYEFRTTVVKPLHEESDFIEIGKWIKGAKKYFLQEFTDSGDLISDGMEAYSKEELNTFAQAVSSYLSNVEIRGI